VEGTESDSAAGDYYELLDEAKELRKAGNSEGALQIYDEVSEELASATDSEHRVLAAFALYRKVRELERLGRFDEMLSAISLLLGRYEGAPERDIRLYVARSFLLRGHRLYRRRKIRSALREIEAAWLRSFDSDDSDFRETAAVALVFKRQAMYRLFRFRAAWKAGAQLFDYVGPDPDPRVLNGVLEAQRNQELFLRLLRTWHNAGTTSRRSTHGPLD